MHKIMVVDDDPAVLKAVEMTLKRNGMEPLCANGGEECLRLLRQGFRGVILLDLMMPGLTGWQTIQAMVRENLNQNVLICLLTAKPSPGSEGEGLEEFVFDYLPKPFENATLRLFVTNALSFLEE